MAIKISWWRRLLSYIEPQILSMGTSSISGLLELALSKNRFMLLSNNAIYSFEDLYHNFDRTFKQINIANYQFNNILVLGMGLGSVPQMLIQKYGQAKANYTLVEIDPIIVAWAKELTIPKMQTNTSINIVEVDAYNFVAIEKNTYDLIVIDVFVDDLIPENIQSIDFLQKLKSLMNSKALLLFNCLYFNEKDKVLTNAFYEKHFKNVFQQHSVLNVETNLMLIAKV